jgi:hypothetical protein
MCQTVAMKSGDLLHSADFADRKRLLLSLATAFFIATVCFVLTFLLFAWLWFHILIQQPSIPDSVWTMVRATSKPMVWIILCLGPIFVMLPAILHETRKKPPITGRHLHGH